jgi:NADPH:quinone reductase-like Zn-dependent oxidoreductase
MGQTFRALLLGPAVSRLSGRKVRALAAKPSRADLVFLKGLIEAGQVAPVIDGCFPLAETAAAFRAAGRPRGKVVITVAGAA